MNLQNDLCYIPRTNPFSEILSINHVIPFLDASSNSNTKARYFRYRYNWCDLVGVKKVDF